MSNIDAAFEFSQKAKSSLSRGDLDSALRLYRKSQALHPSPEVVVLIRSIETRLRDQTQNQGQGQTQKQTQSQSQTKYATYGAKEGEKERVKEAVPDRTFTPEQTALVKEIKKTSDLYVLLGVTKEADGQQITSAYRKLAVKLHPDKNGAPGADEAFKKVKNAYEILNDEERRKKYDRFGVEEEEVPPSASGFQTQRRYESEFTPDDIFNAFFGGHPGMRRTNHRGEHPFFAHFGGQRQAGAETERAQSPQQSIGSFAFLLPFLLILLFSFFNSPTVDEPFSIDKTFSYSVARQTKNSHFSYFVQPNFNYVYGRDYRAGMLLFVCMLE